MRLLTSKHSETFFDIFSLLGLNVFVCLPRRICDKRVLVNEEQLYKVKNAWFMQLVFYSTWKGRVSQIYSVYVAFKLY